MVHLATRGSKGRQFGKRSSRAEIPQDPDLAIARMNLANSMADTLKLLANWKNYCYFMNSSQAQEACEAGYLALRNAHREIKLGRPW